MARESPKDRLVAGKEEKNSRKKRGQNKVSVKGYHVKLGWSWLRVDIIVKSYVGMNMSLGRKCVCMRA